MTDRQKLLQFIDQAIDGGAVIRMHFCESEDTRAKAKLVAEIFNEITGAEVVEEPGKNFFAKKDRIELLCSYRRGNEPITIII